MIYPTRDRITRGDVNVSSQRGLGEEDIFDPMLLSSRGRSDRSSPAYRDDSPPSDDEVFEVERLSPGKSPSDLNARITRCLRELEPLKEEFDIRDSNPIPPPRLITMLDAMLELWMPEDVSDKRERFNSMRIIVERCLGIRDDEEPTPYQVRSHDAGTLRRSTTGRDAHGHAPLVSSPQPAVSV